jgi:hypothetical protein
MPSVFSTACSSRVEVSAISRPFLPAARLDRHDAIRTARDVRASPNLKIEHHRCGKHRVWTNMIMVATSRLANRAGALRFQSIDVDEGQKRVIFAIDLAGE